MLNKTSAGIHTFMVHTTLTAKRYYKIISARVTL